MSAASACLHIHLGLATRFRFGLGKTNPFRGFMTISDIYVMAIYPLYKDDKKTFFTHLFPSICGGSTLFSLSPCTTNIPFYSWRHRTYSISQR